MCHGFVVVLILNTDVKVYIMINTSHYSSDKYRLLLGAGLYCVCTLCSPEHYLYIQTCIIFEYWLLFENVSFIFMHVVLVYGYTEARF